MKELGRQLARATAKAVIYDRIMQKEFRKMEAEIEKRDKYYASTGIHFTESDDFNASHERYQAAYKAYSDAFEQFDLWRTEEERLKKALA